MKTLARTPRPDYRQALPDMFAAVSDLYGRYWGDFFHFAIFEHGSEPWAQALERTHRLYLEELRVGTAHRILEMACGRGPLTEIIADATAGEVVGIDLSPGQLRHARRRRRPNLTFLQHDIRQVDELPGVFDAALSLDAFCYLPDKRAAIEGVASILAPGARLLIVDWCRRPGLNGLQEELLLRPFMDGWAIQGLETLDSYRRHLEQAGLRVLDATDLNQRVRRNWDLAYEQALHALQELDERSLLALVWDRVRLGREGARLVKDQFAAALFLKAAFDAGFLRYVHLLAERR
ncbi:MAG TPA: methyltransferase domain-containing protein [Vicinamibacteria bacterium]|nr:methyltransferase domain-containing protein [Vicinamibacteria bacterium]